MTLKFQEVVGSGHRLADYVATDVLLQLIEDCLKATIETGRPLLAAHKSKRIVQCLRLATIASREDAEFRTDLLEVITPALCGHLAEFQMLSNPIVSAFANAATARNGEQQLPRSDSKLLWQGVGAQILFTLIEFLRLQEPYSKKHREQYWRLLKVSVSLCRVVGLCGYLFLMGWPSGVRGMVEGSEVMVGCRCGSLPFALKTTGIHTFSGCTRGAILGLWYHVAE